MVEPVTVAVLSGVGLLASSVSGWFARRMAKKKKEATKAKPIAPAHVRPTDLPEVTFEQYFQTWLQRVKELFARPLPPPPVPKPPRKRSGTQRIVSVLNFAEPLFQLSVLLLVLWLFAEPVLLRTRPDWVALVPSTALFLFTAAAVGYGTNWIAIKMLFHPRSKNKVWRGIIPDRRDELTETISNSVIDQLIGPDIIRRYLHESGVIRELIVEAADASRALVDDRRFRQETKALIYDAVAAFATSDETKDTVADALEERIRNWTGSDAGARIASAFKALWGPVLKREVLKALPELPSALEHAFKRMDKKIALVPGWLESNQGRLEKAIADWASAILRRVDFKPIILRQLRSMSPDAMEAMLSKPVSGELRFVQVSGGIFGLAVGAALLWLPVRLGLAALGAVLFVIYAATRRPQDTLEQLEASNAAPDA
jgi:hypothetical protein